jgi:hypothetical protein
VITHYYPLQLVSISVLVSQQSILTDLDKMPSAVETAMAGFLGRKGATIHDAYRQSGGWEGWAQVEIAIALARLGVVQREVGNIYPGRPLERADIVLNINSGGHNNYEVLELKCWGHRRDKAQFIGLVQRDITKILTTGRLANMRAWSMVLVVNPAVKNDIKAAMNAMRRAGPKGGFIDQVKETAYSIPGSNNSVYLLSFLMPVVVG